VAVGFNETRHDDVLGVAQVRREALISKGLDDLALRAHVKDSTFEHRDSLGAGTVAVEGDDLTGSVDNDWHEDPLRNLILNVANSNSAASVAGSEY
jgi:hypothetical protein